MGERDESIESVKAAILKELPADPKTTMEFVHSPLGDDIEEWVAVVHVGSDYTTSEGERYTDTRFEIRTTHATKFGAMQKLLAALFSLRYHYTGRPI